MKYYPIFLDIQGKDCVVIGGGTVAERKVLSLISAGAKVKVISPELTSSLKKLAENKNIAYSPRNYAEGDIKGSFMAFSAANNTEINEKAFREARKEGVLLNIVDTPELCDFIVPSTVHQGDLSIAISTSGKSPALAKKIREELEEKFGWEFGVFLCLMGRIRVRLLTTAKDSSYNKKLFSELTSSPLLKLIREGHVKEIDRLLKNILGEEFTLSKLGVKITPG